MGGSFSNEMRNSKPDKSFLSMVKDTDIELALLILDSYRSKFVGLFLLLSNWISDKTLPIPLIRISFFIIPILFFPHHPKNNVRLYCVTYQYFKFRRTLSKSDLFPFHRATCLLSPTLKRRFNYYLS